VIGASEVRAGVSARVGGDGRDRVSARLGRDGVIWFVGLLVLYCALSALIFGRHALAHPTRVCACIGSGDPPQYMWGLEWWPYAIAHGLNPLYSHLTWSPTGVNVADTTTIPLPSLLLWPMTATIGPLGAYNVMALLSPALAALTAYLLCAEICGRRLPAAVAGWVFGFSSYEQSQLIGHAHLMLIALLPLFVLVVVLRCKGKLGRVGFVSWTAVLFAAQLLTSTEVLATAVGFGALALVLAWVLQPSRRRDLQIVVLELIGAGAVAAVVTSPYIYQLAIKNSPTANPGSLTSVTDLYNLVIPTSTTLLRYGQSIAERFPASAAEQGAYFGVPLLLALVVAAWQLRGRRLIWVAVAVLVVAVVLSMGSHLWIGSHQTIPLPWRLVAGRPFFRAITPDRLIVYAWLALAVLIAVWLTLPGRVTAWFRWLLVAAGVVAIIADGSTGLYSGRPDQPELFRTSAYKRVLPHHGEVLILPYGLYGYSMLWQGLSHFWFPMPEGYLLGLPPAFAANPLAVAVANSATVPISASTLRGFIIHYRVRTVIVDAQLAATWPQLLAAIGLKGRMIDGALVYPNAVQTVAR
jgi:hypothetical protein